MPVMHLQGMFHERCIPSLIRLQLADEAILSPAWLHCMDGNFSAKQLDGSGSADCWTFQNDYFIPFADIECFKNGACKDPRNGPNTKAVMCSSNWSTVKATEEDKICVFEQTGIFILACQHGFVECIAEMWHSGELYVILFLPVCG